MPPSAWPARAADLEQLKAWEVRARVGVRTGQEGGSVGWHWQRRADSQQLDFTGPTGKLLFRLHEDAAGARAQDADGKQYFAPDTQALLAELTGWQLPVAGLEYWARGLPIPTLAHAARFDPQARLSELTQAGWSIRFLDYVPVGARELPRKLELRSAGSDEAEIKLKIVISDWLIADMPVATTSPP